MNGNELEDFDLNDPVVLSSLRNLYDLTIETPFGLRILVCSICKVALLLTSLERHLRDQHARFVPGREKHPKSILKRLISKVALSTEGEIRSVKFPPASKLPPPFPFLKTITSDNPDGPYKCNVGECSNIHLSRSSAVRKFREQHPRLSSK